MIAFFAAAPAGAESFKAWAARGAREERENAPKEAFSSYSNALSLWKESDGNAGKAKVLCSRAGLREKNGDAAGALNDLTNCLALNKKNARGFHRRGVLLFKAGQTPAAIGDFYRAVALDLGFAQAYADRALAYESQGENGFAREDYRQACRLGAKAACAKAAALPSKPAPTERARAAPKAKKPREDPAPPAKTAAATPVKTAVPAPAVKKISPAPDAPPSYQPRFKDCLKALDACVENGDSFGSCVRTAPNCSAKTVKGCCPASCLTAYQRAINRDRSEAAAYRENFSPDSTCGKASSAIPCQLINKCDRR